VGLCFLGFSVVRFYGSDPVSWCSRLRRRETMSDKCAREGVVAQGKATQIFLKQIFKMPTVGGHIKLVAGKVSEFSNGTLSS
jgi:hypothetical protein